MLNQISRLLVGKLAENFGRNPDHERSRWNIFSYNGTGPHNAARSDPHTIQDDRPNANQTAPFHMGTVDDGPMPDRYIIFQDGRLPRIAVENGPILNIGGLPNVDLLHISPHYGSIPDAGPFCDRYLPHDRRIGGHKGRSRKVGLSPMPYRIVHSTTCNFFEERGGSAAPLFKKITGYFVRDP